MPDPQDKVFVIPTADTSGVALVTFRFNGGPIAVTSDVAGIQKVFPFGADPFFKYPGHYVSSGSLIFHVGSGGKANLLSVQFTNMFRDGEGPKDVVYRLEVTSFDGRSMLVQAGKVERGDSVNIGLVIKG
jgi:hypothetical protein